MRKPCFLNVYEVYMLSCYPERRAVLGANAVANSTVLRIMPITSISHPLRIDSVMLDSTGGAIGMTLCPGKQWPYGITGEWSRDLDADLRLIKVFGARAVVTLMEADELESVGVPVASLEEKFRELDLEWFHLPIRDMDIPTQDWEEQWVHAARRLHMLLRTGERIVVHCLGGLGRTGTIAARLLVEFGMGPEEAIHRVRSARPGAIQSIQQERYVRGCRPVRR